MELAERFGLPVVTFVDVPGAHPGPESEERGIAEAIARSIGLMSRLRTPIVTVITGEGGSGGALAIAVGDVVIALENAVYSVISPEGCAVDPVADRRRGADRGPGDEDDGRRPAGARRRRHRRPRARRGRPRRPGRDRATAQARSSSTGSPRSTRCRIDELVDARYRRYRALGAYTEAETAELPPPVGRGLGDRLRDLLDPGRRAVGAAVPSWSARRTAGSRGGLEVPEPVTPGDRRPDRTAAERAADHAAIDRLSTTSCCRPSSPSSARPGSASSRSARATGGSACAARPSGAPARHASVARASASAPPRSGAGHAGSHRRAGLTPVGPGHDGRDGATARRRRAMRATARAATAAGSWRRRRRSASSSHGPRHVPGPGCGPATGSARWTCSASRRRSSPRPTASSGRASSSPATPSSTARSSIVIEFAAAARPARAGDRREA